MMNYRSQHRPNLASRLRTQTNRKKRNRVFRREVTDILVKTFAADVESFILNGDGSEGPGILAEVGP